MRFALKGPGGKDHEGRKKGCSVQAQHGCSIRFALLGNQDARATKKGGQAAKEHAKF